MAEAGPSSGSSPFSGVIVTTILAITGVSFLMVVVLLAWSPELQNRDRAGLHPYSSSALGYRGMVDLLSLRGVPVMVSRSAQRLQADDGALKIVTLPAFGGGMLLDDILDDLAGPALIVLPKWTGSRDRVKPEWQGEVYLMRPEMVAAAVTPYDSDATIWRLRTPATVRAPFGKFSPNLGDDMQVLRADSFVSVVSVPGGDLVAQVPGRQVYILSDPDLMNVSGLAAPENARMALALVTDLREMSYEAEAAVVFDATLHGFERSDNLLQLVFDVPFIAATLLAFAAFLMIGWSGAVRFGAPAKEARAFALGKQALTDNTAALVAMGRRETSMAPGYLALIRRATAKAVGAPKTLSDSELTQLFDRLSPEAGPGEGPRAFSRLQSQLIAPAASRQALIDAARRLWRWQQEIIHGHR
ncbi:MAG: hypothetical protein AAF486_00090 [Pseudomonadota bacterium]